MCANEVLLSFRMCLFLTSGVRVLRCEMNAGTDMMWRRKDLSRLSEKCAATTGLKYTRTKSSSHYGGDITEKELLM